jgi:hypothetical protein
MSKSALRSLGIGVVLLDPKEKAHRIALLKKIFAKARRFQGHAEVPLLPGLGVHHGLQAGEQIVIMISDEILRRVSEKIVRGASTN